VVDVNCSQKASADPDSHTRACALKCEAKVRGERFWHPDQGQSLPEVWCSGKYQHRGSSEGIRQPRPP